MVNGGDDVDGAAGGCDDNENGDNNDNGSNNDDRISEDEGWKHY